jgi:hypothetical protein
MANRARGVNLRILPVTSFEVEPTVRIEPWTGCLSQEGVAVFLIR